MESVLEEEGEQEGSSLSACVRECVSVRACGCVRRLSEGTPLRSSLPATGWMRDAHRAEKTIRAARFDSQTRRGGGGRE